MPFRLSDEDRARLGCAEWLADYSLLDITVAELDELSTRFDFDPADWPRPWNGELTLDQAGDPNAKPVPPRWRTQAGFWLMLRQSGHPISWEQAGEIKGFRVQYRPAEGEAAVDAGKAESPPSSESGSSAGSTTRRSKRSSTSRKTPSIG